MGKIYLVGIGPGGLDQTTPRALDAMRESDVIAGYDLYIRLLGDCFPEKALLSTPMRQEIERCRIVVEEAKRGRVVSMVCSGDAGVYGMAGPLLETLGEGSGVSVEVIPGVTAACSGAALLGAPLIHDFAVVSLSDLLTPWELIEKRLDAAASADFVLCLYNPASKKRSGYLKKAVQIVRRHREGATICGVARDVGRGEESSEIMTLDELALFEADMFCTVFIGSSRTKRIDGRMVTPRGYRDV